VRPVPRFRRDVACLLELIESREPPKQLYRAKQVMAFFIPGDASSLGKGVAVVEQYGVEYEAGPWKMRGIHPTCAPHFREKDEGHGGGRPLKGRLNGRDTGRGGSFLFPTFQLRSR